LKRLDHFLASLGLERRSEQRSYDALAPDAWGKPIPVGGYASASAVLSNLAVATRCVSLRSELLASVPLKLYRRLANGDRERVTDSPLAEVLSDLANPLMTAFGAREFFVRSLDTAGNSYARIERDGAGQVTALWPLEPSRVTVERLESGRVRYRYSGNQGAVVLLQEEVLHIRGSSEDGMLGRSPIAIARGALGLGLELTSAANDAAARNIGGYIIQPTDLNARGKQARREAIEDAPGNRNTPKILDPGVKFVPNQFSSVDQELLENRKLSNEDVARVFGVPPASVGISTSVSYGSAQQAAQDLVTNALAPLAQRIEQDMARCLLTTEGRRLYVIEHDLDGLLRAQPTERWTAYRTAREIGAMSSNEIRRFENMPAVEGGDDHTPLRAAGPPPADTIASAT